MNFFQNRRWVIPLIILMAVVVVFVAVKSTARMANKYITLKQQLSRFDGMSVLNPPAGDANHFLLNEIDLRSEVFATVSKSCQQNQVNIKEVHSPKIFNNKEVDIITQQVTLQGDFVKILKSLQDIQTESMIVKISSLRFETEEVDKVQTLIAQVYFQGVRELNKK